MKAIKVMILALVIVVMAAGAAWSQVIPTDEWTRFGSSESTLNGNPLPVGVLVTSYDQADNICGEFTVATAGLYGIDVYGDDLFSAAVDEGCVGGESIVFRINGIVASKLGPSDGLWSGKGPIKVENLSVAQTFAVSVDGADGQGEPGTSVQYSVFVNNDGNGTDLFIFSATSSKGWPVSHDAPLGGFYLLAGESYEVTVTVDIPAGATIGEEDDLTATATSQFDGTNSGSKMITTTVDNLTDVDENDYIIPGEFRLQQNFPNPFNPETNISFNLEKTANVRLEVYDILGRKQTTLYDGVLGAGEHTFTWRGIDANGRQAASGIYFYRLSSNEYSLTRKMALLK